MSSKQSQKGTRFEYKIRDMLTDKTGVKWDRVPMSGAGSMKGDLYCLTNHYFYCFECKSFKDTVIQENLLNAKSNNFYGWWEQTVREAAEMNRKPALAFKKDRGKPLVAVLEKDCNSEVLKLGHFVVATEWTNGDRVAIFLFEDWLNVIDIGELILV